jgi:hypothetical protein
VKKEELLNLLNKGVYWEDEFIGKYDTEANWAFIEATVSKKKYEQIKRLFSINITDSIKHREMLNNLVNKVSSSDKNEY